MADERCKKGVSPFALSLLKHSSSAVANNVIMYIDGPIYGEESTQTDFSVSSPWPYTLYNINILLEYRADVHFL